MQLILSQVQLQPEAYSVIQDVALKFGFPAVLVFILLAAGFYVLYKFGGKITDAIIDTMKKISLSNEKNAEAAEKVAQLIDVMTKQNDIIDKRLAHIEYCTKKMNQMVKRAIIAVKNTIPKEQQHVKDILNQILEEINEK